MGYKNKNQWQRKPNHYMPKHLWCLMSHNESCQQFTGKKEQLYKCSLFPKPIDTVKYEDIFSSQKSIFFFPLSTMCKCTCKGFHQLLYQQLSETMRSQQPQNASPHCVNTQPYLKGESQNGVQWCLGFIWGFSGHTLWNILALYLVYKRLFKKTCRWYLASITLFPRFC